MSNTKYFSNISNANINSKSINQTFDKLNKLSDKLNVLNVSSLIYKQENIDEDNSSKFEFLHQKISEVDDQLIQINENTGKKFLVVKENVII